MLRIYDGKRFQLQMSDIKAINIDEDNQSAAVFHVEDSLLGKSEFLAKCAGYEEAVALRNHYRESNYFYHSKNIFTEVREYLKRNSELTKEQKLVPVLDENNELKYLIEYSYNESMDTYSEYDINNNLLDLEFLQSSDVFVYELFHEYSYASAEVILRQLPDKRIFFLDNRASYFYDDMAVNEVTLAKWIQKNPDKRVLYIFDDSNGAEYSQRDIIRNQIGINALFRSIFYLQAYVANTQGNISAISFEKEGVQAGLINVLRLLNAFHKYADGHQMELLVVEDQFSLYPMNSLKKYFDLDYVKIVDKIDEETLKIPIDLQILWNGVPQIRRNLFDKDPDFLQYLRQDTIKLLQERSEKIIKNKVRMIAVIARGTDYVYPKTKNHLIQMDIKQLMPVLKKIMEEDRYDYVFLATEDVDILNYCKMELQNKLLYVDQIRAGKEDFSNNELLADVWEDLTDKEKEAIMLDYLTAIYCVSKCDALLTTGGSGTTSIVKNMKNGKFEEYIIPYLGIWN